MYQGMPVVHVGQHGLQGAHIQVGRLCQGEASADGPVIHCPLPPVNQSLQDKEAVKQMLPNKGHHLYLTIY